MTQVDFDFDLVRLPKKGGQCWQILMALKSGERLTVGKALNELGVYALSQRIGELKRMNWPIKSRMVKTAGGATVAEYWMPSGYATEEGE